MLESKAQKLTVKALRMALESGESIEAGGYRLAPELALGLDVASLKPPSLHNAGSPAKHLLWLELSPGEQPSFTPSSLDLHNSFEGAHWVVSAEALRGPSFWQSTEIETAPILADVSMKWLETTILSAKSQRE